jgi:cob(I)alamin adenosyltransferase
MSNYDIFEYLASKGADYNKNDSRILYSLKSKMDELLSAYKICKYKTKKKKIKKLLLEINSKF